MFAISAHLLLICDLLFVIVSYAKLAPFVARNISATPRIASRTASAVQARQMTRQRYVDRAEKHTLAQLFARVDCTVPEPSTLACPCVDWDTCGTSICVDLNNDEQHCGSCGMPPCLGYVPACCAGTCADLLFDDNHCGICTRSCDGQSCCNGNCFDTDTDTANCGACFNACDPGEQCCGGTCVDLMSDPLHCNSCDNACEGDGICDCGMCIGPGKLAKRAC